MAIIEREHLAPTNEITLETVKQRAVRGVMLLTGRTFLLSVLSLAATGLLTVFLSPSEFGVFWIVSAIVNFLTFFGDVGLAAALIQKKDSVTKAELNTTFLIQQSLVIGLLVILYLVTPALSRYYSFTYDGRLLLYALGAAFLFSSLKSIPSALLERELEFGKLVIPQVVENLVYNLVAVYLAWQGFGIRSFAYAVLARGIVGFVLIYILKPWFPGLEFSKKSLKKLLSYGVPYQANTLLATVKDDGMTAFLGGILGSAGIGFLGWAQKWGQAPLRFFMDHVLKVTFPAFSRMQDKKEELENAVTRSVFFICFLVFPSIVGLLVLAPELVQIIPRYEKWSPALIPLGFIGINTIFAASTTQLTNLFNSIGKIKTTFKFMVMWTTLSWAIIPLLSIKYGVNGAAAGYAIVSSSSVIAVYVAKKYVDFSLAESVFKPLAASLFMGLFVLLLRYLLPTRMVSVWVMIGSGVAVYLVASYLLVGQVTVKYVKKTLSRFK